MEMNKEDEIALEDSIGVWKQKRDGIFKSKGSASLDCPLCILGAKRECVHPGNTDKCKNCIIKLHTGHKGCHETPYHNKYNKYDENRSEKMVSFLKSLRPTKETKECKHQEIKVGDTVEVFDGSFSMGIRNNKYEHIMGISMKGQDATVVAINLDIPGDPNFEGEFNDILIVLYDRDHNHIYVFVQTRHVRLLNACPKCGYVAR